MIGMQHLVKQDNESLLENETKRDLGPNIEKNGFEGQDKGC